ncbi:DNA translocase FtsK [Actomonas aquatica]|uniref:DNA translocase FtsK n=1 Tax=Actomonas aquatica TaxID=2866162 RepID=A0ABZ1C4I1_9BACT|nr:DNA translocase FtsK [Opitutus sp. WL0086]WRQ86624.1 DNA translocase FtsK [Opitutus sp. WL0086]
MPTPATSLPDPIPETPREELEPAQNQHLSDDERQLAAWREGLEQRLEERAQIRARHRDQLEDAYEHLQSLRDGVNDRAVPDDPSGFVTVPDAAEVAAAAAPEPVRLPDPFTPEDLVNYQMPSLELLRSAEGDVGVYRQPEDVAVDKAKLQDALDSFAVDALVQDAIVGPRVTQYLVRPGFGVRVEAIASLDKNIALAMSANAVRIQAPIPGEQFVGVEVPHQHSAPLALRSSLENAAWRGSTADLPLMLGVDVTGRHVMLDLAKAPHALIAGATGAGKSVCISNLILSLIYRFRPDELELVLIDPKIVEFAIYRDLPHLIHPVVTDPKQACQALKWLVREMERRYQVLAEKSVRNLAGYNAKATAEGFAKLPYIVLVIDELADLMMTAPQEIEGSIARLAQMSRAVGIHTVLATQRPSVNVITGVIKANYPTRIAFQVSSQVDSRTIIDGKGAESLQGRGDMLFSPPGIGRLQRLQAPYVDDAEIEAVVGSLKAQVQPRYRVELRAEDAPGGSEDAMGATLEAGADPMLKDALEVIATQGRASTSYLQRRLKIGYNRAASLIEELEERHYIGPQVGNNPREIFVQPEDLQFA